MISPKTAKRVGEYIKKLVLAQPRWLKQLFDDDKIAFCMEPDSALLLEVDAKLDEEVKEKARTLIHSWINKHPAKFLAERNIFH